MFSAVVSNVLTICIGGVLVWSWVAFISELIASRAGKKAAVPYPDDALWARFGRSLLGLGLFGGVPSLETKPSSRRRGRPSRFHDYGRATRNASQRWNPGGRPIKEGKQ